MTTATYTAIVDLIDEYARASCGSCSWEGEAWEGANIGTASLTPGDPSPAGRCPDCDALIYLIEPDPTERR